MINQRKRQRGALRDRPLIALRHCCVVLDGKPVLNDVHFELRAGERWALIGPNGSGKTLFLKLLRGDVWPTPTGRERRSYCLDGELNEQPVGAKERIAYLGPERQDKYLRYGWNHSVAQVVATGLFDEDIPRTQPNTAQRRRVARLLRHFRLWSLRDRGFLTLSYGQRRRALIARAFAGAPAVLLLDEVFNGLDAQSRAILRRALGRTRGMGSTWIMTTHRPQDVPASVTHRASMEGGKIFIDSLSPRGREMGSGGSESKRGGSRAGPFLRRKNSKSKVAPSTFLRRRESKSRRWTPAFAGVTRALISLRNVDLYRDYRLVLRKVNWTIRRGEHWAVIGANGSGKSSLLKLIYGDLHPKLGGTITREGLPAGTPIADWKRRVGFISPELQAEYQWARTLEEVVISGRYSSLGLNRPATAEDRRVAHRWLRFFGIAAVAERAPREVSYGQMRRALLARALINNPKLLLLDEPCAGLDGEARRRLLALLEELAARGVQVVITAQQRDELPRWVARCLRIKRDRSVAIVS